MQGDPCTVCKGTDLKLIDGFYYCVECNTQNTNVRETVVEQKTLGDGTIGIVTRRKIVKLQDSKIQMSGEWYKWHAYNFIILGLADELVAVGAKPSFKTKLLWIWTRYIKKYQKKEELAKTFINENRTLASFMVDDNTSNPVPEEDDDELEIGETAKKTNKKNNVIIDGSRRDIGFLSKGLLLAMLYLALNLDDSDLQLSHLYRFLKEKRLNLSNLQRFVPDDIDVKSVPLWINFLRSKLCTMHQVRALALSLLRKLDLGTPRVPDLRKIVDNFLTELCLPNDMKQLIYSLMHFHCCDFLDINNRKKDSLVRTPDYEAVVMTYVLVATKICFGLDGDYEVRLSNTVQKINEDRGLTKSHRIGQYSEPSTRLFSFREWCSYLQFRKIMLCKCCLHMSEQLSLDIDDYVYMEHLEDRPKNDKDLQDETAMDLINKIPEENEGRVIPKELFIPTLTPMSTYTDIIIEHSQDLEMRKLLCEDFTQYSLKYACEYLDLVDTNAENIIKGVSENKKTINKVILGTIVTKTSKSEMVYVKNCENRNWMTTNPPTMEHVTCEDPQNECNDKESDHGYDSEHTANEKEVNSTTELNIINDTDQNIIKHTKQVITEETDDKNIFDDLFEELELKDELELNNLENFDGNNEEPQLHNNAFPNDNLDSDTSDTEITTGIPTFNPDTFDREQTIKELMVDACKKYKIPIPAEYKEPRKRKVDMFGNEARSHTPYKRPRTKYGESKKKVEELLSNYYSLQHSDIINQVQHQVNLAVRNTQFDVSNVTQINTVNQTDTNQANEDLIDALERSSICTENMENQSNANLQNGTLERNPNLDITNKTDINNQTVDEIDTNLESTLFEEDEEMKLDELIPKGDPKFDEEKYDVNQLFMKIKPEDDDYDFQEEPDPKLDEILRKKIEECKNSTEFMKLKPKPIEKHVKTKYESDSEDEIPLNVLQDEINMIKASLAREDSFDTLINKDNISEFKYWFRHYDADFMLKSVDLHKKFDEELKENTPASFYFVIKECASIINSSTFYLYKQMQLLEQFILSRAKNPD